MLLRRRRTGSRSSLLLQCSLSREIVPAVVDGKHHDVSTERIVHEIGAWPMRSEQRHVSPCGYHRDEDGFIFCNRHLFRLGMLFLWTFTNPG